MKVAHCVCLFIYILSSHLSAQHLKSSGWHIVADAINPDNYYGITLANGIDRISFFTQAA